MTWCVKSLLHLFGKKTHIHIHTHTHAHAHAHTHARTHIPKGVNTISNRLDVDRDFLLAWLSNTKEPDKKIKIRAAINDFRKSFANISNAYMFMLGRQ